MTISTGLLRKPANNLIRICVASIKPVDRQMAAGTHYASPRRLPVICGIDEVGRLEEGRPGSTLAADAIRLARWGRRHG